MNVFSSSNYCLLASWHIKLEYMASFIERLGKELTSQFFTETLSFGEKLRLGDTFFIVFL
jgi:hypothetical protein